MKFGSRYGLESQFIDQFREEFRRKLWSAFREYSCLYRKTFHLVWHGDNNTQCLHISSLYRLRVLLVAIGHIREELESSVGIW